MCDALCDLVTFVQFKKRENTNGGMLLLVTLHAEVFFTFFKLYKWYQIAQSITCGGNVLKRIALKKLEAKDEMTIVFKDVWMNYARIFMNNFVDGIKNNSTGVV